MRSIAIIQRLRPHVLGTADAKSADFSGGSRTAAILGPIPAVDVAYSFSRIDLEAFMTALHEVLPDAPARLDTPALLGRAIDQVIHQVGGDGVATVRRSPAGLRTPEYWRVEIRGLDPQTRDAVERLARGARPQ